MNEGIGALILPEKYKDIFPPKQQGQLAEPLDDILTGKFQHGRIELSIDGNIKGVIQHKNFDK